MVDDLVYRAWSLRAMAIPAVPGGQEVLIELITDLLRKMDRPVAAAEHIAWPSGRSILAGDAHQQYRTTGLLTSKDRTVNLTSFGREWLRTRDLVALTRRLHANVRYVGELMAALGENGLSHQELLGDANQRFDFKWKTLDQIRRRTAWLRATGMIELRFDRKVVLTEEGSRLVAELPLFEPSAAVADPHDDLPGPAAPIKELLVSLDKTALAARRAILGYVPRGEMSNVADSIRGLVTFFVPPSTKQQFRDNCQEVFDLKPSSTESVLTMLRAVGLVRQVGPDEYAATDPALAWLESANNIDLVRIAHSHVSLVGELLTLIEEADRAPELARLASDAFGLAGLSVSEIRTRLHLLKSAGLVRETAWGRWERTASGDAFLVDLPLAPRVREDESSGLEGATPVALEQATVDDLIQRLRTSSLDSSHPENFEHMLMEVFRSLGFEVVGLGGPGRTDLLLELALNTGTSTLVVVDAKSSASGEVGEGQINLDTIAEHRAQHEATRAAIVGPGFNLSRLPGRAAARDIALITVDQLVQVMRLHARTPLSREPLSTLFGKGSVSTKAVADDAARWEQVFEVAQKVLEILAREARENDPNTLGALNLGEINILARRKMSVRLSIDDVKAALGLLSGPLIRAVAAKGDRYYVCEPITTITARVHRLADALAMRGPLRETPSELT